MITSLIFPTEETKRETLKCEKKTISKKNDFKNY